jgi:phenylalanyl-tRNA synthetase beta chain
VRAAQGADRKLIKDVSVFDLFESEALGPDKKSLAIEVTLQPTVRTLTEAEIDATAEKIVGEVSKATGGTLRA